MVSYPNEILKFREQIAKLGCGICLDHYGSTDSSIDIVSQLHPDMVKLYPKLSSEITKGNGQRGKVAQLVGSANENKSKVIGCNIEDPEALSTLWNMGARYFQGYFIKEPNEALKFDFKTSLQFEL